MVADCGSPSFCLASAHVAACNGFLNECTSSVTVPSLPAYVSATPLSGDLNSAPPTVSRCSFGAPRYSVTFVVAAGACCPCVSAWTVSVGVGTLTTSFFFLSVGGFGASPASGTPAFGSTGTTPSRSGVATLPGAPVLAASTTATLAPLGSLLGSATLLTPVSGVGPRSLASLA